MSKIKVGIVGGAGYTGGEAARLLIAHPEVELAWVHSNSNAGKHLYDVHSDMFGQTDLCFAEEFDWNIDVAFLCLGHGDSRKFLEQTNIPESVAIIDLSQDFRLCSSSEFGSRKFIYGLPELNRDKILQTRNIANPGCFATCLQLGLLPLAAAGLLKDDVHVAATTGSTGAGQKLTQTSHFSWRLSNLSTYKMLEHQHLLEIGESVHSLQSNYEGQINFIPYRGDFARGIIASIYTSVDLGAEELTELYKRYYGDAAFTFVSDKNISLKQVVNTNKCLLYVTKHDDKALIVSCIDNLLKGACGQAVQNMNLMMGLDEKSGLNLKAVAF